MNGVAIIIPCFNLGRTVEEAVDSALQQTRPADEIIVVDDGSTDLCTRQVLSQLRRPNTRIVRTPNRGLSRTRNHGIELSSAPYIVLLDADDVLEPEYVEKTAGCLDDNPDVDIVSCALKAFEGASYVWTPNADVVGGIVKGSLHASTLFRRRVFETIGGFDPDMPAFEASEFWIRAMERGFTVRILGEPLLRYRVRAESKYHKAITGGRFVIAREALLRKHAATVEHYLGNVMAETDSFLVDVERHRTWMMSRRDALELELGALKQQREMLLGELARQHLTPVDWGHLRTLTPLGDPTSTALRGYFVSRFVTAHRADIAGRVLTDDPDLARWLGETIVEVVPLARVTPDGRTWTGAANSYDCVLLTRIAGGPDQARAFLTHVEHVLKPAGVMLCVFSCFEPFVTGADSAREWRFTQAAVRVLLSEVFALDAFETESVGNVKLCTAALHGLRPDEIDAPALNACDPWFPLLTCARAIKRAPDRDSPVIRTGHRRGATPAPRGAVLMYHRIATLPTDERRLSLAPPHFRRHMAHLRRHYRPMSLEEMARVARDGTLPDKAVAVTLDDGYLDALTTASPILAEFDMPATFFLNTLDLDEENEFWGDTLERIFFEEPALPAEIDLELAGLSVRMPTRTAEERRLAWQAVSARFYPLPADQRVTLLKRIVEWTRLALRPRASHRRMVTSEIASLAARARHTIGAHTTHHLELPVHSPEIQRWEMANNKQHLEQLLGRPVVTFSYPYGIHDAASVEAARAVPFVCAVTTTPGLVRPGADLLTLPRLEVPLGDVDELAAFLDTHLGDADAATR